MRWIDAETVEFTDTELLVKEIHGLLLDQGYSPGGALIVLRGTLVPAALRRDQAPMLDEVLTPEFASYLADGWHYAMGDTPHHRCWCGSKHHGREAAALNGRTVA